MLLVLTARQLAARSVARIRQAALANRLSLGWVCDGMIMVGTGRLIRPPRSRLEGRLRRLDGDEAVTARADQVLSPRMNQGFPHLEVVLGLEELKQGPLHLAIPQVTGDVHALAGERVESGEVNARV